MKTIKFVIFIIVITVIFTTEAAAQAILPLTVAPARQEITVDPGEQTAINVRFYNTSDSPISGIVKVADFIVDDNQGSPRIIENVSQAPPRFAASNWLTLPYDKITIAGNDKVSLQAKIKVPDNATAGGRYIAVYFEPSGTIPQAVGAQKEAGTGIISRIASLVYLTVNGPVTENAIVSRFFTKSFWEYGPIEVQTEILNRSDLHIRPKGVISLTNAFGGLVDQQKLKEQNIFPDISRSYKNNLGKKWLIGRYRIDLSASYGKQGKALTSAIYVWVFPWKIALIIVLTLIIFILLGKNFYQKMVLKEAKLEKQVEKEKEEIEKLKEELRKRQE